MKVSEYIEQLERLKELHGDLRVYKYKSASGFDEVTMIPEVGHVKILNGSEFMGKKWNDSMDESEKGEKVIHL